MVKMKRPPVFEKFFFHKNLILPLFIGITSIISSPTFAESKSSRPNIIVILSDDMGWSDIGPYGSEIQTPTLDKLAKNGLRFSQFYNNARCCPTRASLLTGLYPHQAGVGHMLQITDHPGYQDGLSSNSVTIAQVLSQAGYDTIAVGKWHVTNLKRKENWPLQRGFSKYYGIIAGAASFFDPTTLTRGNTTISAYNDPDYKPEKYYFTDAITDNAIKYLEEHKKNESDKPFFLYTAYTAAHWPMQALQEDIDKYKGKYDQGYDATRKARIEKLKELGLIPKEFDPAPTVGDIDKVNNKEWELRNMEVYAAMIDRMDQGIGKLVNYLDKSGELDNTIIFFLQDNGACAEEIFNSNNDPNVKYKPLGNAAFIPPGHPTKQTRDGRPVLTGPQALAGPDNTYQNYGLKWANVSNTPFREYKHWVHEGGISTPLIVHWPKGISKERNNSIISTPSHLIDLLPTAAELGHATYPISNKGFKVTPLSGVSLASLISQNTELKRPEPIFWEHESNRAVRDGNWKLVSKEKTPWELYDISKDRAEMHNLADQHPEKVKEMSKQWDDWAKKSDVLPLGAWKEDRYAEPKTTQTVFTLKQGEELDKEKGPSLLNRGVKLTVEIKEFNPNGVLVSQGGRLDGYALYLQNGKLGIASKSDSQLYDLKTSTTLTSAKTIQAILRPNGARILKIDGKVVAEGKAPYRFLKTPVEGTTVGNDPRGKVGEYPDEFVYNGIIDSVSIEVLSPLKPKKKK